AQRIGVIFWRNAQHEFATGAAFRCFAQFLAGLEVVIHCFTEGLFQLVNRRTVKTDGVVYPGQMAYKNMVFRVELDAGGIAAVAECVHGLIPIRCSKGTGVFNTVPKRLFLWVRSRVRESEAGSPGRCFRAYLCSMAFFCSR